MRVIVKKDYESISKEAANIIKDEMVKNPNIVLGLATGSTPVGMYQELIRFHKEEGLDFSNVTTFNLDEYVGIDDDHPNSYHYFMKDVLFDHININMENTFVPDGKAEDPESYCREYDRLIEEKGGIDIQILGIGENGHIAFNEPDKKLNVGTSIVDLTQSTIEANSRFFDSIDEVPKTAITMGIGSIMKAKKIILLANGKKKAKVIKELLKGEKITTDLPASMLLLHPDVTVIVDEEAYNG
ncbi:glucosamine-6-phosphate deaminase [Clostridium sp. Cult3]|uniref:glucosamine-6-phosphate deaminase n=1 Tax=Clostridium sp. Cult3 TaxID=2079004 RepID=UPI001F029BC5|nr:glucosamine-6-phosphate deaminase [Clostridium sp. Cult3]MCF6459858.1 glucosamine-6-phosphate deaminase [Clostridium sp. Cult3]